MYIFKAIITILIALYANLCSSNVLGNNFTGSWCWEKNSKQNAFLIIIKNDSKFYRGGYFSVALGGNRIDDNENAFAFKISGKNKIKTFIESGINNQVGVLQLTIINNNKIEWKILKLPEGDFYVPQIATLYRCSKRSPY